MSTVCKQLEQFLQKLSPEEAKLFEMAMKEACNRLDPTLIQHLISFIEKWVYMSHPRMRFPGFFKKRGCISRVPLPEPLTESKVDVLKAIRSRRSRRKFQPKPLNLELISTVLYYSVGVSGEELGWPLRVYPSAGGLQPAEAYLVAWSVEGLEPGIYHYEADEHQLCLFRRGDFRDELVKTCLGQRFIGNASAAVVLTGVYARTASKYGARSYRYIHLDLGGVMENLYLVVEALGLATVAVGAFYDRDLCKMLDIDCYREFPVLVMPIGWRA